MLNYMQDMFYIKFYLKLNFISLFIKYAGLHFKKLFSNPKKKSSSLTKLFPAEYEYVNYFFPARPEFPELVCERSKNHPR